MPYTVYAMSNTDDTHIYVGCTKRFKIRCYQHMYDCKNNTHHSHKVQALYNLVGPEDIEFDVVEEYDNKADARAAEQKWVDYYKAAPEWQLMNLATENVGAPTANPEIAAKAAAKISSAMKGKKISSKHIAKISAALTGYKHTAETKAKMSAAQKGKACPRKAVYIRYTDGTEMEFMSTVALAEHLGVSQPLVSSWVTGKSTSYTNRDIEELRIL